MDRTREGRRSSMSATTTNGFPRRRHRTIGLRDSSEEGHVELQETVRLRAVTSKRDRDRDRDRDSSSNRGKRRRASHREEGEQSTEESVGNDDYVVEDVSRMLSPNTASSISDQNHRRSFPTSRPLRPTPPPWKVADEMIGVPVPRKARSASAKRSHDSWASASGGTEEQNFRQRSNSPGRLSVEATSPSSSNVSVWKKKSAGPKTRLPNAFKSSSSPQEDIEIEIAEVLYGLMTSKNQETSQKLESNDTHGTSHDSKTLLSSQITYPQTSILSRSTSPSSRPFNDEGGLLIAGRDTTAATLSWAIYMIMTHSHVAEKLYLELKIFEEDRAKEENVSLLQCDTEDHGSFKQRVMQFSSFLNKDSLEKLQYLHAVITETLRLYPAVPQDPKGILEDDVLPDGTKIKAGGMVTYVPYSMGRMEYNWGPDAASFRPERWFKDGIFRSESPFKFTAFQAGPRICLGKDSAYLQMRMAMAILCRFYKFHLVPGHVVKYRMMTILSMANGLKLNIERRC